MKENILNTLGDCLSNFYYYDRKEDDELPVGAIEKAIKSGIITKQDLIDKFTNMLDNEVE